MSRRLTTANTPAPRTHLLSNGHYSLMLTNAGGSYSVCRGLDITRWREDRTRDCWGQFQYVRDLRSGLVWSAGFQPICRAADEYEVVYSLDKAEFRRRDGEIATHREVVVSSEHDAEIHRITISNHGLRRREVELTSYAEIVLSPHAADLAHPAFGKLFLETEFIPASEALLCRRRPRSEDQRPVWAVHVMAVNGRTRGALQYETDRGCFLGRGRAPANPAAMEPGAVLSFTTGPVLDPIFSLRRRIRIEPRGSVSVAFTTAFAESREQALALADQYRGFHAVGRAFELAWAQTQVELSQQHLSSGEAHLFQRLGGHVIYAGAALRAPESVLALNRQGQAGLWRYGLSGDRPIVLARVSEPGHLPFARELIAAHGFWRLRGLEVDLVLLCERPAEYFQELYQELQNLVRTSDARALDDQPSQVFVRKAAEIPPDDMVLLETAARVVLDARQGPLAAVVDHLDRPTVLPRRLVPRSAAHRIGRGTPRGTPGRREPGAGEPGAGATLFANGLGGFLRDGSEYVIELDRDAAHRSGNGRGTSHLPARDESTEPAPRWTPTPWINVVANPSFGFLVSESGAGYTWAGNSQTNRLTPWNNDPVSDPCSEAVYLRDEASGEYWTPTPLPSRSAAPYRVRHGQGYSVFEHESHGVAHELRLFVPAHDPIKIVWLRVRNTSGRPRRLSAAFYAEWVLGTVRDQAAMNVSTAIDPETGALFACNPFNADFGSHTAFADANLRPRTVTGDRTEFLGRNRAPAAPAALERVGLSGRVGAGLDPCAALHGRFELKPDEEKDIIFTIGQADSAAAARALVQRYRDPSAVRAAFDAARRGWESVLGAVQVHTPDPALDLVLNRWLVYQTLSCRLWGRSAFYQSGGAYGFRDQLQDIMALVYGAPHQARAHLLRAAAHQFVEGDVQHWWHPPAGRGVRTRFSDDYLWLPFVTCHYVTTTGDKAVLDEPVPFLRAPRLAPGQEEDYRLPERSDQSGTLYEHCVRAIENGFRFGAHGLPLMGTGDWNDGMNRVGDEGKGESVWVAWFLIACLDRFAGIAQDRGDAERAGRYRAMAQELASRIEQNAWDGAWYIRAYFDDGTPLGSAQNDECQIDSIAQTWGVISGAANPDRARRAMDAVIERLVRPADRLIRLFTPSFDKGKLRPGYIKGYLPGIRENGGQYTHAATWVVEAAALQGRGNQAMELFNLLNPVRLAATPDDVARYRVEPYVVAADIYAEPPHVGRGGWTWYTGSAAWLYRVALESLLGFRLRGSELVIDPCIPAAWQEYTIAYRHRSSAYRITVANPAGVERGVAQLTLDGRALDGLVIPLSDDGGTHDVRVVMGT